VPLGYVTSFYGPRSPFRHLVNNVEALKETRSTDLYMHIQLAGADIVRIVTASLVHDVK